MCSITNGQAMKMLRGAWRFNSILRGFEVIAIANDYGGGYEQEEAYSDEDFRTATCASPLFEH